MFRKFSQKARKQDGFTLIELIVVVAILGILAAVLTPRVLDAIDNAKENSAETFGKELQLAVERYYIDNNGYPTFGAMEAADGTASTLTLDDLVAILQKYSVVSKDRFSTDSGDFHYKLYDADGDEISNDGTNDSVKPASYEIKVKLADAGKTLTVQPGSVTVAD